MLSSSGIFFYCSLCQDFFNNFFNSNFSFRQIFWNVLHEEWFQFGVSLISSIVNTNAKNADSFSEMSVFSPCVLLICAHTKTSNTWLSNLLIHSQQAVLVISHLCYSFSPWSICHLQTLSIIPFLIMSMSFDNIE